MADPLVALLAMVVGVALAGGASALWLWRYRRTSSPVALKDLDFVAIDVETTGLDPRTDALVALAAIPFVRGQARAEAGYACLVNPGRPIPLSAQAIHGITDAEVRDAPAPAVAALAFLEACDGCVLVAHTASFDLQIMSRAIRAAGLPPLNNQILDIGVLAHALFPSWWDLSLDGLARLTEVEPVGRHTAEGDAVTAGLIFLRMVPLLEQRAARTLSEALRVQRRAALIPSGPGTTGGGLAGP